LSDLKISVFNTRVDWNATHKPSKGEQRHCDKLFFSRQREEGLIIHTLTFFEGVNSLGPPQSLQAYPSFPVALSYSLPLSVTLHLIRSEFFLYWAYTVYTAKLSHLCSALIPLSFHLPICLPTCLSSASLAE